MTAVAGVGVWIALVALTALAALRTAAARVERLRRACHELRGPLSAVRLGLELEARGGATAPARLRTIDLELERAALVLQDLERFGRAARSGASPGPARAWEPLDVRHLLADSVEAYRPVAVRQEAELELTWLGPPAVVYAERLRLAQALGNLIANAVEHGGGRVEVRGRRDGGEVRIEVLDEGPGLAAPVSELAASRRGWRDGRHRGRGLAIAMEVARAHGGRLAASPSNRGARLLLALPALEAGTSQGVHG